MGKRKKKVTDFTETHSGIFKDKAVALLIGRNFAGRLAICRV
jgi:hypothetical protein